MEARKITVLTSTNRVVLMSSAETLGELKVDMSAQGINCVDKVFMEGLTHTEFSRDDAVLPKDVKYHDEVTNELVFMVTEPNQKIKSGISAGRQYLYDKIKSLNMETIVKNLTGCNYQNLSTAKLKEIYSKSVTMEPRTESPKEPISFEGKLENSKEYQDVIKAAEASISALSNCISALNKIITNTVNDNSDKKCVKTSYQDAELENMFR